MADVTEIGDLSRLQREPHARARNACLETLAAISFGRHHRLRGRGAEDRESVAPAAPSVATQPTRVSSRRVPFLRMGFFNDKSGNPAYILAEKVRRHGGHARLATPRVVTARALPRPSRVLPPVPPPASRVSSRTKRVFCESESRHLEDTRGFLNLTTVRRKKKVPIDAFVSERVLSFASADRAMPLDQELSPEAVLTPPRSPHHDHLITTAARRRRARI